MDGFLCDYGLRHESVKVSLSKERSSDVSLVLARIYFFVTIVKEIFVSIQSHIFLDFFVFTIHIHLRRNET